RSGMFDAPAFTAFPLDRADAVRRDEAALAALAAREDARIALFWRLKPLVRGDGPAPLPAYLPRARLALWPNTPPEGLQGVFRGLDGVGAPIFAAALPPQDEARADTPPDPALYGASAARFVELREAAATMDPAEASILGAARSVLAWHEGFRFCPKCG